MNNETFQVGEVAVFVRPGTKWHNQECEIVGPLELRSGIDYVTKCRRSALCYLVRHPNKRRDHFALPEWLRKKKPPTKAREIDQVVAWKDCLWHPKGVEAKGGS